MTYSEIALRTFVLKERENLTLAGFWKNYGREADVYNSVTEDVSELKQRYNTFFEQMERAHITGFVCIFDECFPKVVKKGKKNTLPYLLFYKGDISLLANMDNNVAVIGLNHPTENVIQREKNAVKRLVADGGIVVSGLAKGCDTVAHQTCIECGGKTIAILPTQIDKIFPAENKDLADKIVESGGLLVSEYYKTAGKYESIGRFPERDRLQAMFSKSVVMIASYSRGSGDSGSRYAMETAADYGIERFVMYNRHTDSEDPQFELNRYYALPGVEEKGKKKVQASVLGSSSIARIKGLKKERPQQHNVAVQTCLF